MAAPELEAGFEDQGRSSSGAKGGAWPPGWGPAAHGARPCEAAKGGDGGRWPGQPAQGAGGHAGHWPGQPAKGGHAGD